MRDEDSQHGSVTGWLRDLEGGDAHALNALADRYFQKLAKAADLKMTFRNKPPVEGDDVAIVALMKLRQSMQDSASHGRIKNRDSFWLYMLAVLRTVILDFKRKHNRERNIEKTFLNLTDLAPVNGDASKLLDFVDGQPDHESLTALKDSIEFLLQKKLKVGITRDVARLKLQGLSNKEVAEELGIDTSSVLRKLKRIEQVWTTELGRVERVDRDDSDTVD